MGDNDHVEVEMSFINDQKNAQKIIVRVYLIDGSHKTVYIDQNSTMEELWYLTCEKLFLNQQASEAFFLYGVGPEVELQMYAEQKVGEVVRGWSKIVEPYKRKQHITELIRKPKLLESASRIDLRGNPSIDILPQKEHPSTRDYSQRPVLNNSTSKTKSTFALRPKGQLKRTSSMGNLEKGITSQHFKIVFKPAAILTLEDELQMLQPEAIHLFYIQAVHDIINSNYPCPKKFACAFAGIQMQVDFGDHNPEIHKPGFLFASIESYIPKHFRRAHDWGKKEMERLVIKEHIKLKGKNVLDLKKRYLNGCRHWIYYRSTFFRAYYIPLNKTYWNQTYEGPVNIGINFAGFHIIFEADNNKTVVSLPFNQLVWWQSDGDLFQMEFQILEKKKKMVNNLGNFKTRFANLINDLLSDWVSYYKEQNDA